MAEYRRGDLLYENPLAEPADIEGWEMEGEGVVSFPMGRMRMENRLPWDGDEVAHFVHWCPEQFPDSIAVSWDFWPQREP